MTEAFFVQHLNVGYILFRSGSSFNIGALELAAELS